MISLPRWCQLSKFESPVVSTIGIRIAMVLTLVGGWYQHLVDVEGAFLNGVFEHPEKHKLYVKIPEAYQQWYPPWVISYY